MPVEQGLPWHPAATGLAGQAIPFIVAASHAHALPSAPFWFPVPAVLIASPASLCPSSLSAVLALVPLGVAPAFCVSVLANPPFPPPAFRSRAIHKNPDLPGAPASKAPIKQHPRHPSPCVTLRRVAVSLRGPGQSPILPFACCVGSLRRPLRPVLLLVSSPRSWSGSLVCRGSAGCGGCRLCVSGTQ